MVEGPASPSFALSQFVGSPAISSTLLVAALDLNLVQLLRQAIRTADATTAAAVAGTGHHIAANSVSHAAQQTVNRSAGVRHADSPAATYSPSPVLHLHPRLNEIQPESNDRPVMPVCQKPFIQPPWRTLPWPKTDNHVTSHCKLKVQYIRTDISDVGRTLDLFI